MDRRLGGLHSGRGGEGKNSHPPLGIEPHNLYRPAPSLVAISTELSRLLLPCYSGKGKFVPVLN
jgi:hypothetical protein